MSARLFQKQTHVLPARLERPLAQRCLIAHQIERLAGIRAGDAIVCADGVLWVTLEGDTQDYILTKGQAFVASREGIVLVEAFNAPACRFYLLK